MNSKKPQYIKCPRCELNYIQKKQKYCDVCKAELKLLDPSRLLPDDDALYEELCPICNENPILLDADMCQACLDKQSNKEKLGAEEEIDKEWREYLDEEPEDDILIEDEMEISLSELEEEENDPDDEENEYPVPDDFDYSADDAEFAGDDDDDEEEDEDEDF